MHTKKASNILAITYEGTSTVKLSKMQMLTKKFENI